MADRNDEARLSAFLDGELAAGDHVDADDPALARLRRADDAARLVFDTALEHGPGEHAATVRNAFIRRRRASRDEGWRPWVVSAGVAAVVILAAVALFDREMERRVENVVAEMREERASDMAMLARAMQDVLETRESGTPVRFTNDTTGTAITLLPRRTWQSESGHWCRQFAEIPEGADPSTAPLTTACRDAAGRWQRVTTDFKAPLTPLWEGDGIDAQPL